MFKKYIKNVVKEMIKNGELKFSLEHEYKKINIDGEIKGYYLNDLKLKIKDIDDEILLTTSVYFDN